MDAASSLFVIALLIGLSALFSMAELSVAASRRIRLKQMLDLGERRAKLVMDVQDEPGDYFTVIQIGQNTVAILAGLVGEGAFAQGIESMLAWSRLSVAHTDTLSSVLSFLLTTSLFILLSDLLPKRLGIVVPERVALRVVGPMRHFVTIFKPVVWLFKRLTDVLSKLLGLPERRDDTVTPDDILAVAEAGAQAGTLARREHQVIENVIEMETRMVTSAMTGRERIVHFLADDSEALIRARIDQYPHSTYLVCNGDIDHVLGYVDSKHLLRLLLNAQPISLRAEGLIQKVLMVPDRLTLSEVLTQFRQAHEDFAVIVNEYSLVVGMITINDVMSTVMGELVSPLDEEQIVRRDDQSWLIDGMTPIEDVMRALEVYDLPHLGDYDTLAGFLMVMLRRIPRRTDFVEWAGFRFEVMDVDNCKIDQVMVTRLLMNRPASTDHID